MDGREVVKTSPENKYWLDNKKNIDKIVYALVLICVGLFLSDLMYHKHTKLAIENWFGFYAWYGFICCVSLVLLASKMRKLLKRDEDYYGD